MIFFVSFLKKFYETDGIFLWIHRKAFLNAYINQYLVYKLKHQLTALFKKNLFGNQNASCPYPFRQ